MRNLLISFCLLFSSVSMAGMQITCPDLHNLTHKNPIEAGWKISPFSNKTHTEGPHLFREVHITTQRVMNVVTAACYYEDGLHLYQVGQFNHAKEPQNWIKEYGFDACSSGVNECVFYKH